MKEDLDEDVVRHKEKLLQQFPVKCDHCPFTGVVAEVAFVDGMAKCPKCGGTLAGNRPIDIIMDALRKHFDLEGELA